MKKAHGTNRIVELNKKIDGFYTKTTQKGGFSKLCVKIKKRCYTNLLHFSTRKHNLVYFVGRIVFSHWVKLHRSFFIYWFFFQEKTLGDISFKLETKIMNFMSVFFLKKNIIKTTQVLSIICNTICLQFFLYRAPLQSLGLILLISSRISDFKCHSY